MAKKLMDEARALLNQRRRGQRAVHRIANDEGRADHHLATDLYLTILNEGEYYPIRLAIGQNMQRKIDAGKYDTHKAPQAWLYLVNPAAKKYERDFGVKIDAPTKRVVAKKLATAFEQGTMFA